MSLLDDLILGCPPQKTSALDNLVREKQADQLSRPLAEKGFLAGFTPYTFDLGGSTAADWAAIPLSGSKLYYQRAGSTAPGRLDVDLGNGRVFDLAPGTTITEPFQSLSVRRSRMSVQKGEARLVAFKNPASSITEPQVELPSRHVLLAPGGAYFRITSGGLSPYFSVFGWSVLRLLVDVDINDPSVPFTSFKIIPRLRIGPNSDLTAAPEASYEMGLNAYSVPDSDVTGYKYRLIDIYLVPYLAALGERLTIGTDVMMSLELADGLPAEAVAVQAWVYGVK